MQPDNDAAEHARWEQIVGAARSAEHHAAILDARARYGRTEPADHTAMVSAYARAIMDGTYTILDALPLTAVVVTDLARVVDRRTAGLPPGHVEQASRNTLARYQLVSLRNPHGTAHLAIPGTVLVATLAGVAVIRGIRTRRPVLSPTDVATLAALDRTPGPIGWPGSATAERMCLYWRLAEKVGNRYRLTIRGSHTLEMHRSDAISALRIPSAEQDRVLRCVIMLGGHRVDLSAMPPDDVKACAARGWVVRSGSSLHSDQPGYTITEAGRDAASRAERKRDQDAERPKLTPHQLHRGHWVRLLNRGRLVGPEYVQVIKAIRVNGTSRARGWEVWVTGEQGGPMFLYGARAFHPTTKFETRPPKS